MDALMSCADSTMASPIATAAMDADYLPGVTNGDMLVNWIVLWC